jgi:hypothetical protein
MRVSCITVIKSIWVSSGLFMLPLGLGTFLVGPGHYASQTLLPIMLLLSFPAGPLVLLVLALVFDPPSLYPPLDYSLAWFITFAAGYFQWFCVFPELFGKCEFTTLGLAEVIPATAVNSLPIQPLQLPRRPKRSRIRPRHGMAHFDKRGRTPLERVIFDGIRRNPSSQVLSKKPRDLPGINRLPGHLG